MPNATTPSGVTSTCEPTLFTIYPPPNPLPSNPQEKIYAQQVRQTQQYYRASSDESRIIDAHNAAANTSQLENRSVEHQMAEHFMRAGGAVGLDHRDLVQSLRVACPNVEESTIEATLKASKGDVAVALCHLQTNANLSCAAYLDADLAGEEEELAAQNPARHPNHRQKDALETGQALQTVQLYKHGDSRYGIKFGAPTDLGFQIVHLTKGGEADKSERVHVGDVLYMVNGKEVSNMTTKEFKRAMRAPAIKLTTWSSVV